MKSLCIKTNNSDLLKYLLNELKELEIADVCFSLHQFKHYKNIIIHYTGENETLFLEKISSILSLLVIDELEENFINKIILEYYFYFDCNERKDILNLCFDIMSNDFSDIFDKKFKLLYNVFYNFLLDNKNLYLQGFTNFRLKSYFKVLDDIVAEAVNCFVVEKEYLEFVSLLKLYINSQGSSCNLVHLIYTSNEEESILLDENKEIINISHHNLNAKYLSDISFSANDYTLNTLLTLLPKEIYIHLIDDYIDDFINTLITIFENRVHLCTDCNICNLYRHSTITK